MPDKYENFAALVTQETEGVHFRVRVAARPSPVAVLAPHGGLMERGTSEIAEAIAGERFSFYCFESLFRRGRDHTLHITSERFDEPRALALVAASEIAIGVHGRKDREDGETIWVGGLEETLRDRIGLRLVEADFSAKPVGRGHRLSGRGPLNICNRGRRGAGVQLELPLTLRKQLLADMARHQRFAAAVRDAVEGYLEEAF